MTINELNTHIIDWAKERELDTKGTIKAQAIKTVEELSELIKAICKDKKEDIIDSIGDVYVTLVIGNMLDKFTNIDFLEEEMNLLFDSKAKKACRKLGKRDKLDKMAELIQLVLRCKYESYVIKGVTYQLIEIAYLYKLDFTECVESAYNTIKDRHGKLVGGMYVKDEDLVSGAAHEIVKKIGFESVKNFFDGVTNA